MFGTGLGRYLPFSWRKRIHRLAGHSTPERQAGLFKSRRATSARTQRGEASAVKYATDFLSVAATNNLYLCESFDLGVSENIYISLTTTPIRARSPTILEVLDSLVAQSRKAKKIYLSLPLAYRRSFAVDWEIERPLFIDTIGKRYGDQIEIIACEDFGPGTKLLGLIGHPATKNRLASDGIIIVVDDDIVYSNNLVRLHELCHDLYQCDVGIVDEIDVIESWVPLKFKRHDAVFTDIDKHTLYGWLSYSIKYQATNDLPQFYSQAVARVPDAFFHDDAIFSAYIKKQRLYATHINAAPLSSMSRSDLDTRAGRALRTEGVSHWKVRVQIEKKLEELLNDFDDADGMTFRIPVYIAPRSVRNCSNLIFNNGDGTLHFVAHYLAPEQMVITITVFDTDLIGTDAEVVLALETDYFKIPLRLESAKFSLVVHTYRPLARPLSDHAELPIMQTNSTSLVSRNKFYSVCTILNYAPTHAYSFFDGEARARYIELHFSELVQKAACSLIPGAYEADFFRYLFAYLNTCIYFDVKTVLNVPISALYHFIQDDEVFVEDINPDHIYNAFFINRRIKAPVFKYAILLCLDRIIANDYGNGPLSVTGPEILGLAKSRCGSWVAHLFKKDDDDWKNSAIRDQRGAEIIRCAYPGYYDEDNYLGKRHYAILWKQRKVFRLPPAAFVDYGERVMTGIDHVLWINLARAQDRKAEMDDLFRRFPLLPQTRIEAVDARNELPWAVGAKIDDANASNEEIACCLSHLKAADYAGGLEGKCFLIVEDDISLRTFPFLGPHDALDRIMQRAPADWEIIVLSWTYASELHREFTDWNRAFDDGFHIAGTAAYLVNRPGLARLRRLFELRNGRFTLRPPDEQRVPPSNITKFPLADVFLYSHVKSYVYRNKIFVTRNKESYIHADHVDWHKQTQNITFNQVDDDLILRTGRDDEIMGGTD